MPKYRVVIVSALLVLLGPPMATLGISQPVPQGTFPMAVNARGEIAGHCVNSILVAHGFLRDARERITVFDAPGAGSQQRQGTFASDINDGGTIVGHYIDSDRVHHGYVREPNGALTALDAPGAGTGLQPPHIGHPELLSGQGTLATGVNDAGVITGYFIDAKNVRHGFLRDQSGAFLTFDVPDSGGTYPESINNSGEITGSYSDPPIISDNAREHSYRSGAVHGFVRDAGGKIIPIDVPGAAHAFGDGTYPQSVNDGGIVVGTYDHTEIGFIRDPQGVFTSFNAPESRIHPAGSSGAGKISACYLAAKRAERGASHSQNSAAGASTPVAPGPGRYQGDICQNFAEGATLVGEYGDAKGLNHGFVRGPNGALATFDAPADAHSILITSVSPIVAGVTHSVTIKGRYFGKFSSSADAGDGRVAFLGEAIGRACMDDATPGGNEYETLRVARWTDSEIVVTGFSWPPKGICPFHAGDTVTIGVWNAQTGSGPANFKLTVGSTSKDRTPPHIASVTAVYPGGTQKFVIKGEGFGTHPVDHDSAYLTIWNETSTWLGEPENPNPDPVPHPGGFQPVTIKIGRWTPNEIEVTGFGGDYGKNQWTINGGDHITLSVWNPQTGAGPATFEVTVASKSPIVVVPRITSISPLTARAKQTILIQGQGFGTHPPSTSETTQFLQVSDETAKWTAGRAGQNAYSVWLNVSHWMDSEIELTGFAGAYGSDNRKLNAGDQIKFEVWNAQTGAGPAVMNAEIGRATNANSPQENSAPPKSGGTVATVSVPAYQPWTFTEINLRAGDSFAVDAEGTIVTNLAGATASPDGTPPDCRVAGEVHVPFVAPELPCWSLLGRIGPQGAIFEVGSHANLVAGNSGQLYLGVNDNFFGDNSRAWTAHVTANSTSHVAVATDCVNAGNAHGLIQIVSGTGPFAKVDEAHKSLSVVPGSLLQGTVALRVINGGPGFAVAPLIQTTSWGDHETSWSSIGYLRPGESQFTAQVNLTAPVQPGTYHILFAFQLETNGGSVASATSWARYKNIWNDGNDIADFNSSQIQEAQQTGCAINRWLTETGIQSIYVPADAITVGVITR